MRLAEDTNALKKLRKASWKFQQTFQTPAHSGNLSDFVATIISSTPNPGFGSFTVGVAVISPDFLMEFFAKHSLPQVCASGTTVTTASPEETEGLLFAAFCDPLDFLFAPQKKPFVLYADHDRFTTFFGQTRGNLNRVVEPLTKNRFRLVSDYQRLL